MDPRTTPKCSCSTDTMGARQLVVQEALETTRCPSFRMPSFTPMTMVASTLVAGAEISTFFAPAARWAEACSPSVKIPVDSTTRSTPRSPQGRFAGSRSETISILFPFTASPPFTASTGWSYRPWTESNFSRCASVALSVRSVDGDHVESGPLRHGPERPCGRCGRTR